MKLSKDPGRPKSVHLFMFMFYWCEQRELCLGKVNQSFFRLALTLRGVGFSHPLILTFYSCCLLSLLWLRFLPPSLPPFSLSLFSIPLSFFHFPLCLLQNKLSRYFLLLWLFRIRRIIEESTQTRTSERGEKKNISQVLFDHATLSILSMATQVLQPLWYTASTRC